MDKKLEKELKNITCHYKEGEMSCVNCCHNIHRKDIGKRCDYFRIKEFIEERDERVLAIYCSVECPNRDLSKVLLFEV